jgi:hypothetical protein
MSQREQLNYSASSHELDNDLKWETSHNYSSKQALLNITLGSRTRCRVLKKINITKGHQTRQNDYGQSQIYKEAYW